MSARDNGTNIISSSRTSEAIEIYKKLKKYLVLASRASRLGTGLGVGLTLLSIRHLGLHNGVTGVTTLGILVTGLIERERMSEMILGELSCLKQTKTVRVHLRQVLIDSCRSRV